MSLRTHTCGELRGKDAGGDVALSGWVQSVRDHGGVIFVDLRDRYGRTQVVFRPEDDLPPGAGGRDAVPEAGVGPEGGPRTVARGLRPEDVVRIRGRVEARPQGTVNPELPTGEVEVRGTGLEILARSETPPFEIADSGGVSMETRLRHRYLDIRNPAVMKRFLARSRLGLAVRSFLHDEGFAEVETPFLTRSTPEGARDYLVPSRVQAGRFFALPQSPQIFKQILMIAGIDRYYQIVRCFRDEDLRADRQPEFTQLDLEMSFVTEDDVLGLVERAVSHAVGEAFGIEVPTPLPRISHAEAMARFGTDRPDTRFGLEITDVTGIAGESAFRVFREIAASGGTIRGIRAPGGGSLSRKQIGDLERTATDAGAKGLSWMKVQEDGFSGPLARHFGEGTGAALREAVGGVPGDLVLLVADRAPVALQALGALRLAVAKRLDRIPPGVHSFLWVTDFPLFEETAEGGITFSHHPFTGPAEDDLDKLEDRPLEVRSRAYDLVLNGTELGSGSIRIHSPDLQRRIFGVLGIPEAAARERFGFLLDALDYGAPPHGGIALGYDRLVAECLGLASIREVIAFPKTAAAACPLTGAPAPVAPEQLRDLGLSLAPKREA